MFAAAQEIKELWMEYEENSSMEAKVVKDFDKVCIWISRLLCETGNFLKYAYNK